MNFTPSAKPPVSAADKVLMSGTTISNTLPHVKQKSLAAFTLIELSIVLVIIGLIVGGVSVGIDLYNAAKVRKMTARFEEFTMAYNTFRLKYNCVPGDCPIASQLGLGASGNNDGTLTYPPSWASACAALGVGVGRARGECQMFWVHLGNAGLLNRTYQQLINGVGPIYDSRVGDYFPEFIDATSWIYLIEWNGKLYYRTGLNWLTNGDTTPWFGKAALTGKQFTAIARKLNIDVAKVGACGNAHDATTCPNAFTMPVIPQGLHGTWGVPWFIANSSNGGVNCYNYSGGNVTYRDDGQCNLLWELK